VTKLDGRLIARLMANGAWFQVLRLLGKPKLPQAVSLEVTQKCVASCIMCNIWRHPETKTDLGMDRWLAMLNTPLFRQVRELDITGGEPFLRNDLIDLIGGVCRLRGGNLRALHSFAITTNGLLTDKVVEATEKMLDLATRENLQLIIVCAVDATDTTHDRIRNHPGAWEKVSWTIAHLEQLRRRNPNLILGLKTTILPLNVHKLQPICDYAREHGLFTIMSPCIITPGRYLNPDLAERLAFTPEERQELTAFFRDTPLDWGFHGDAMARLLTGRRWAKTCSTGYNYLFLRSNGDMMLCPLVDRTFGNFTRTSIEALYRSPAADRFRRRVGRFAPCRHCTEPGLERYALTCQGFGFLGYTLRQGRQKAGQVFQHMGLDKLM
jgi:MoaA/NifB/PqqE/SkfB family radical SAM enzyme